MSGEAKLLVDGIANNMTAALVEQQEEWLRSLGIKTEDDARRIAKHWELESDPVQIVETGDNSVRATQTVRMVRRSDTPTIPE